MSLMIANYVFSSSPFMPEGILWIINVFICCCSAAALGRLEVWKCVRVRVCVCLSHLLEAVLGKRDTWSQMGFGLIEWLCTVSETRQPLKIDAAVWAFSFSLNKWNSTQWDSKFLHALKHWRLRYFFFSGLS